MSKPANETAPDAERLRRARRLRVIAWGLLFSMGGTEAAFNVYHAVHAPKGALVLGLAVLYGLAPVVAAMGMSEIVAIYDGGLVLKGIAFGAMVVAMILSMDATAVVAGPVAGTGFRWLLGSALSIATLVALYVIINPPAPPQAAAAAPARPAPRAARAKAAVARAVEAYEPSVPASVAHEPALAGQGQMAPAARGAMAHGPAGATPGATQDDSAANADSADSGDSGGSFAQRAIEHEDGRERYRQSLLTGPPLSDRALAKEFGRSRNWGAKRIEEVEAEEQLAQAQ